MTLLDPVVRCRPIAKAKCFSVNNLPGVTGTIISTANDSVTVSILEETLLLLLFSNWIRNSSSDSVI